jgi:hypothetical protein
MKMIETQDFRNYKTRSHDQIEGFIKTKKNPETNTKGSF